MADRQLLHDLLIPDGPLDNLQTHLMKLCGRFFDLFFNLP